MSCEQPIKPSETHSIQIIETMLPGNWRPTLTAVCDTCNWRGGGRDNRDAAEDDADLHAQDPFNWSVYFPFEQIADWTGRAGVSDDDRKMMEPIWRQAAAMRDGVLSNRRAVEAHMPFVELYEAPRDHRYRGSLLARVRGEDAL